MSASKAKQITTSERRAKAIGMRLAGIDDTTIAARLGYASRQAVSKDIHRAHRRALAQEAEMVALHRQVEIARLDRLQAAAWSKAIGGDLKAIETVRSLIALRAKIGGLELPIATIITGPGGGPLELEVPHLRELEALIAAAGDGNGDREPTEDSGGEEG